MALKQYIALNNNALVGKFASVLSSEDALFAPTFICIGHSSSKDWLVEELVSKMNIVGNCVFQKQHDLVHMVHTTLTEDESKKELYQTDHLQWFIFSILRSERFRTLFPQISEYYKDDMLMQFTLAEKVTDLFSAYQDTAIDVIELFKYKTDNKLHFDWQQYIWRELQALTEGKFASLPVVYQEIQHFLEKEERQNHLELKIPNIHVFGEMEFSPEFVQFLSTIGAYTNVSVYRVQLAKGQDVSRFAKNNSSFSRKIEKLFNDLEVEVIENQSSEAGMTLLDAVKAEIEIGETKLEYTFNPSDDSISIANCFTEYREVEALWNYLVLQFEKNKDLALKDVCVVVPNIEKYAPAIKAVFKNDKVSMDYTFYDSSSKIQDSPYKALLALYEFDEEDFTSKNVFSLLEFKYIREQFGFSEDLSIIKKAINEAAIYHGFEGDSNLETNYVSWKNGLKRLIMGACIEKTDQAITVVGEKFYPVSEFEDRSLYELIRLNHLVESLHCFLEERKESKTLTEWQTSIKNTIEVFLNVNEYEPSNFDKKLEQLVKSGALIPNESIAFNVIKYYLKKIFENQELSQRIGFGGIRIVSPNPYMVTAFKINCFLGLNGSDFLRSFKKLSFDLRNKEQITLSNELDKHLFLSLIQGAKEKLYLSYIGQSTKDNSTIPASTLVEDLLAVCKKWKISAKNFVIKHPLHSFSNKYNTTNFPELIRYQESTDNVKALRTDSITTTTTTKEIFNRDKKGRIIIQLHDLIRFMEDPIRHYYNKILGIYYSDKSIDLVESEFFDLGHLEKWAIKNSILQGELKQELDEQVMYDRLKMNGQFPLKNLGERIKQSISVEADKVVEKVKTHLSIGNPSSLIIRIELNENYVIEGSADSIFGDKFLFATVSGDKWKYQVRAVIQFLAVIIASEERINKGIYVSKDKTKELVGNADNAKAILKKLCIYYEEGTLNLKHFSVEFEDSLFSLFEEERTIESFIESLNNIINDSYSYVNPSEYFVRELNNGSMSNQNAMDTFSNHFQLLRELLTTSII